jgi:hypothetical protein
VFKISKIHIGTQNKFIRKKDKKKKVVVFKYENSIIKIINKEVNEK